MLEGVGSRDEEETLEGDDFEGEGKGEEKETNSNSSSGPLGTRDEAFLRAGLAALLRLCGVDLCLRLGVESDIKAAEAAGKRHTHRSPTHQRLRGVFPVVVAAVAVAAATPAAAAVLVAA